MGHDPWHGRFGLDPARSAFGLESGVRFWRSHSRTSSPHARTSGHAHVHHCPVVPDLALWWADAVLGHGVDWHGPGPRARGRRHPAQETAEAGSPGLPALPHGHGRWHLPGHRGSHSHRDRRSAGALHPAQDQPQQELPAQGPG